MGLADVHPIPGMAFRGCAGEALLLGTARCALVRPSKSSRHRRACSEDSSKDFMAKRANRFRPHALSGRETLALASMTGSSRAPAGAALVATWTCPSLTLGTELCELTPASRASAGLRYSGAADMDRFARA